MVRTIVGAVLAVACLFLFAAKLEAHPSTGIVVDRQGRVYFADERRNIVWRIDTNGKVSPYVTGRHSHAIFLDSAGNLYGEHREYVPAGEKWKASIWKMTPGGQLTDLVPLTTSLKLGWGVIVDRDGNRYSGDWFGSDRKGQDGQIMKRTAAGGVTVLAGRGSQQAPGNGKVQLGNIRGLALGPDGALYFTEDAAVHRLDRDGSIKTLAGGIKIENPADDPLGEGTTAYLAGLTVDPSGNVYVADFANRRVIKITPSNQVVTVIRCEAPWAPTGVALMGGNLYILEHGLKPPAKHEGPRVRKISPDGTVTQLASIKD